MRCWHELGDRRAVLLPPTMARDDTRLDYFLPHLPWWIRVAVEFRHPSWDDDGGNAVRNAETLRGLVGTG